MSVPYKKIILPLDGSDLAVQALSHAEELAHASGAKLVLLRVIEDEPLFMTTVSVVGTNAATLAGGTLDDEAHRRAVDEAKNSLDRLAASLHHRKIDAVSDIATGDAASQIVEYAAHNGADLIVMSTHGRSGLKRLAYGSVANKVLQAAPCPVLIVRPMAL